ncbi:membrane protein [Alishewanella sp. WH16-1]|nr:membrane protein [Alishewanella sp. WH16-1]
MAGHTLTFWRILILTALSILAFAGNSLLSRAAFTLTEIDANSFTLVRLTAGALTLLFLVWWEQRQLRVAGSWLGALSLFGYAILFSYAYLQLDTATGALILFAAVQLTMLLYSVRQREQVTRWQWLGALMALSGMVYLLLPGAAAPSAGAGLLMIGAGMAWGLYSLLGRTGGPALLVTAGNFVRSVPLASVITLLGWQYWQWDLSGVLLAVASGALTSGIGYAIWYRVLPALSAMQAASVQLAVPVVAALLAVILLAEPMHSRLLVAGGLVLSGLGLVLLCAHRNRS